MSAPWYRATRHKAATSSDQKFIPPSYEFHPEFGYVCPSDQLRQNVRVGLAAAAFGIVMGLVVAMTLFPRHGADPARIEPKLAQAPPALVEETAPPARPTSIEAPAARPASTEAPADGPATAPVAPPATALEIPATTAEGAVSATTAEQAVSTDGGREPAELPVQEDGNEASPPAPAPTRTARPATARGTAAVSRSEFRRGVVAKKRIAAKKRIVAKKGVKKQLSAHRRGREPDPRAAFASRPFGFQATPLRGHVAHGARDGRRQDTRSGWFW